MEIKVDEVTFVFFIVLIIFLIVAAFLKMNSRNENDESFIYTSGICDHYTNEIECHEDDINNWIECLSKLLDSKEIIATHQNSEAMISELLGDLKLQLGRLEAFRDKFSGLPYIRYNHDCVSICEKLEQDYLNTVEVYDCFIDEKVTPLYELIHDSYFSNVSLEVIEEAKKHIDDNDPSSIMRFLKAIHSHYSISMNYIPDEHGSHDVTGLGDGDGAGLQMDRFEKLSHNEYQLWKHARVRSSSIIKNWIENTYEANKGALRIKLGKCKTVGQSELVKLELLDLEKLKENLVTLHTKYDGAENERNNHFLYMEQQNEIQENNEQMAMDRQYKIDQQEDIDETRHQEMLDKIAETTVIGQMKKHPFLAGIALQTAINKSRKS